MYRTNIPTPSPNTKGNRQAQLDSKSMKTLLINKAIRHPVPPDRKIIALPYDDRSDSQCSIKKTDASEVSAPAHNPCIKRAVNKIIGANIPIDAYDGQSPIDPVAIDAISMVKIKLLFLP